MCHTCPKAKFNSSAPRRNKRLTWNRSRKLEFIPWPRTQQLCGPFQPRSCTMKGWRSCWLGPIPMIPVTTSWWMVYFTMVSGRSVFNLTGKGFTHLHRFTFEISWREPQFFEPKCKVLLGKFSLDEILAATHTHTGKWHEIVNDGIMSWFWFDPPTIYC